MGKLKNAAWESVKVMPDKLTAGYGAGKFMAGARWAIEELGKELKAVTILTKNGGMDFDVVVSTKKMHSILSED